MVEIYISKMCELFAGMEFRYQLSTFTILSYLLYGNSLLMFHSVIAQNGRIT
jgi:hypothetical protein